MSRIPEYSKKVRECPPAHVLGSGEHLSLLPVAVPHPLLEEETAALPESALSFDVNDCIHLPAHLLILDHGSTGFEFFVDYCRPSLVHISCLWQYKATKSRAAHSSRGREVVVLRVCACTNWCFAFIKYL